MNKIFSSLIEFDSAQLASFRALVEKSGGRVGVFVHPFFGGGDVRYHETRSKLFEAENLPKIVLEHSPLADNTFESLKHSGAKNFVVLHTGIDPRDRDYIQACDAYPYMILNARPKGAPDLDLSGKGLVWLLEKVGAKKVFVAGQQTTKRFSPTVWLKEMQRPTRKVPSPFTVSGACAGTVYRWLLKSGKFKVRLLPNACYPDRPKYLPIRRRMRKGIKPSSRRKNK